jgi:hypothetical protein
MSILKGKLPKYLRQLAAVYDREQSSYRRDVITHGKWHLREGVEHDNWNGGMAGHTVMLFAPLRIVCQVSVGDQNAHAAAILEDLRSLSSSPDEYFASVIIEVEDDSDPECRNAIPLSERAIADPDSLAIWKPGLARVFMSHRDRVKVEVQQIADAMETYGMSCFVAHETIPDDEDWQKVILDGLDTMEIMVAVTTDDFSQSPFCMQEVGYALGRRIPVVSLKIEGRDPSGFLAHKQATRGSLEAPIAAAQKLAPLLSKRLRALDRYRSILINSFCQATDFNEARYRFDRLKAGVPTLDEAQAQQIASAYRDNPQLHQAIYLDNHYNRLTAYMREATGNDWKIEGKNLSEDKPEPCDDLDDVPF